MKMKVRNLGTVRILIIGDAAAQTIRVKRNLQSAPPARPIYPEGIVIFQPSVARNELRWVGAQISSTLKRLNLNPAWRTIGHAAIARKDSRAYDTCG